MGLYEKDGFRKLGTFRLEAPELGKDFARHEDYNRLMMVRFTGADLEQAPEEPMLNKAAVGRMVYYHLMKGTGTQGRDWAPAIIIGVRSDTVVDLLVFPDFAPSFREKTCILWPRRCSAATPTWSWELEQ